MAGGWVSSLIVAGLLAGCGGEAPGRQEADGRKLVVCTTTMIADLASQIGGDRVRVVGLMKPGQDPHMYDPTPQDSMLFRRADLVLVNGVGLEGQMLRMIQAAKNQPVELGRHPEIALRGADTAAPDPHVWWNVRYFMRFAEQVRDALGEIDPDNATFYEDRARDYLEQLEVLDDWVRRSVATIPASSRYMITTHDAFYYYGEAYGLEVDAVLGISTEAQARAGEQGRLAGVAHERGVPAIFHETSVSAAQNQLVDGVRRLARDKYGMDLRIAGPLYSDSLGEPGSEAGTYIDAVRANTRMIVEALGGQIEGRPARDGPTT